LASYSGSNGDRDIDVSHQATWSIDDATVGSLGDNGLVTANNKQNSELVLTANFAALSDTANFKVNNVTLESIRIAPEDVKFDEVLPVDLSVNYLVYGQYSDGIERPINASEVTWSASVNGLVTINNDGNVLGLAAGELAIQAQYVTDQTHNATDDLRVSDLDLWDIYLSPNPYTTPAGTSVQYQLVGAYSDHNLYPVPLADVAQWGSSMPEVASVLVAEGQAQTELEGSTVISAWYNGYVANADLHVTPSCIPGTFGRAAIAVDTTLFTPKRADFKAKLISGSDITIDWGDGNSQVWNTGTAVHLYNNDYQGDVVFTWDACNPSQLEDLELRHNWTGDISQLNQLPLVGGDIYLQTNISIDGDASQLKAPVTGDYYTNTSYTSGSLDKIAVTATTMRVLGSETLNVSAIGEQMQLIRMFANVSLIGTAAELPQNAVLTNLTTAPKSPNNENFSYHMANLPRTIIRQLNITGGAVGTGLIEDIPAGFGSEPNPELGGSVYLRLSSSSLGEITGDWNNYDWSTWIQPTDRFQLDGAVIPSGDIGQVLSAGPSVTHFYIHGISNGQYANIYGNADNMTISNKQNMRTFHILTQGEIHATGTNGPRATENFYFNTNHSNSSYTATTLELSAATRELVITTSNTLVTGPAEDITADPSYQFSIELNDPAGNLTGSFNEQGKNASNLWRIFGAGNKATVDLAKVGFNAKHIYFYGNKDGVNGGIATMSQAVTWSNVQFVRVEMIDQVSMSNLLESIKTSSVNNGEVTFFQPVAPTDTTLINEVKAKGWKVFHNSTEL
uniref:hypothetical protein n=1 Tax=Shewanella marina TaxID=487319 RepID=UPI00055E6CAB